MHTLTHRDASCCLCVELGVKTAVEPRETTRCGLNHIRFNLRCYPRVPRRRVSLRQTHKTYAPCLCSLQSARGTGVMHLSKQKKMIDIINLSWQFHSIHLPSIRPGVNDRETHKKVFTRKFRKSVPLSLKCRLTCKREYFITRRDNKKGQNNRIWILSLGIHLKSRKRFDDQIWLVFFASSETLVST